MTSPSHNSGTDRIYEAVADEDYDIIINVQGDEPLLPSKVIDELIDLMKSHPEYEMATVAVPAKREEVSDPNRVKVVFNASGRALYFSRSVIPYLREGGEEAGVYRHCGSTPTARMCCRVLCSYRGAVWRTAKSWNSCVRWKMASAYTLWWWMSWKVSG